MYYDNLDTAALMLYIQHIIGLIFVSLCLLVYTAYYRSNFCIPVLAGLWGNIVGLTLGE